MGFIEIIAIMPGIINMDPIALMEENKFIELGWNMNKYVDISGRMLNPINKPVR
ncbi:MAG: hypothetical protein INQ03_03510 [Candidatus Heimdallarchaeota archaeon]|nr:hypothetical protein [Candidatus Heimdallarchaeota archaeon]